MAKKKAIPDEIKQQAIQRIDRFNEKELAGTRFCYVPRWRRGCLYLDRIDDGTQGPICRLTFTGDIDKWQFAIFKYSSQRYDPEEWWFPGAECVDGTIEGAMKAGMEAYYA